MAGRTPVEAFDSFARPFQAALSCITNAYLTRGKVEIDRVQLLMPATGPLTLSQETDGSRYSGTRLDFLFVQHYRVVSVENGDKRGPYRVTTDGWMYSIRDEVGSEILAFHWNPTGRFPFPHLHVRSAILNDHRLARAVGKQHIPTGRISIEEVIRLLIQEFHVKPLKADWEQILEQGQAEFEMKRSWPKNYSS